MSSYKLSKDIYVFVHDTSIVIKDYRRSIEVRLNKDSDLKNILERKNSGWTLSYVYFASGVKQEDGISFFRPGAGNLLKDALVHIPSFAVDNFIEIIRAVVGGQEPELGTIPIGECDNPSNYEFMAYSPIWDNSLVDAEEYTGNPKDAIGRTKIPLSRLPEVAIVHGSLGMLEGAYKYNRHNYRSSEVYATVYVDAALRHLLKWLNGSERDYETNVHQLGSVIACCAILLDAQLHGTLIDDRYKTELLESLMDQEKETVKRLQELFGKDEGELWKETQK